MKNLLLILLLVCAPALAVTRDYCECGASAQSGCTATTPSKPDNADINTRAVGDIDRYCEGGHWINPGMWNSVYNTVNTGTRPFSTPITLVSKYTAGWGGGGVKPLFTRSTAGAMMNFGDFGSAYSDGGYIIQDAKFVGPNTSTGGGNQGINLANDGSGDNTIGTQYVTIQRMEITEFDGALGTAAGGVYRNVKVLNNNFHHNTETASLAGDFRDTLVENNDISYNNTSCIAGASCGFEHGLYWSTLERVVFRNNRFIDNSKISGTGDCNGGNFTMHGFNTDVVIEDNSIVQTGGFTGTCFGFSLKPDYSSINEQWVRTILRRNTVVNTAIGIYLASAPSVIVENNKIITTATSGGHIGIGIGMDTREDAGDAFDTGAIVRNNTIRCTAGAGCGGIQTNVTNGGTPANMVVANNIVDLTGATGTKNCFNMSAIGTYTIHNYNLCYGQSVYSSTPSYANLAAAQAGGYEANGLNSDPLFSTSPTSGNSWSVSLQSSSPAIAAGNNTNCARLTNTGRVRTGTCTLGTYQYGLDP